MFNVFTGTDHIATTMTLNFWKRREQRVFGVKLTFKPYRIRNSYKKKEYLSTPWYLPWMHVPKPQKTVSHGVKPCDGQCYIGMGTMTNDSVPASLSNFSSQL